MTSKQFARLVPSMCFAAAMLANAIPAGAQVIYAGFAPGAVAYGPTIAPIQTPFCTPYSYSQWVWQPGYGFVWCPVAPAAAYVAPPLYAPAVAYPPAVPYAPVVAYPPAVPYAPAVAYAPSVAPVPYYTGYSSSAFFGAAVGLGVLGLIASAANQPIYGAYPTYPAYSAYAAFPSYSPFLPSVAFAAPYPAFAAYSYYPGYAMAAANPAFAFAPAPAFARVNNITNVRRVTVVRNARFFHRPFFGRPARFAAAHPALFRRRFAALHPARFAAAHTARFAAAHPARFAAAHPARFAAAHPATFRGRFAPGRTVVASAPHRMAAPAHFPTAGRSFAPGPRPMMPQRMAPQSRGVARPMMAAPRGRPPR